VSRRYPELTDGSANCDAKPGQKFGRAQPDLLRHDRLVGFDGGYAEAESRQTARSGGRGNTFGDQAQPHSGRFGLLELLLQAELANGLREQVG
jgi:hypothetical protein